MRAALGRPGATVPLEVIEAGLWERLHCLPSQLDREDIGKILRGLDLLDLYRMLQRPTTDLSEREMERLGKALQIEIDHDRRVKH